MATHDSNTIIKFADETTVIGLITDNNETAYREEIRDLTVWCQDNNIFVNLSKTKELLVDYRKRRAEHSPIHIDWAVVEKVESFKFLGVHISKDLSWSKHTNTVVRRARQYLFPLRRLKICVMGPQILQKFYSYTIESVLTGYITAWYGNCSASRTCILGGVRMFSLLPDASGTGAPSLGPKGPLTFSHVSSKYL
jgi:hypothetical protein